MSVLKRCRFLNVLVSNSYNNSFSGSTNRFYSFSSVKNNRSTDILGFLDVKSNDKDSRNGEKGLKAVSTGTVVGKQKSKLNRPLQKSPEKVLDGASEGYLEAVNVEFMDYLNEALNNSEFKSLLQSNSRRTAGRRGSIRSSVIRSNSGESKERASILVGNATLYDSSLTGGVNSSDFFNHDIEIVQVSLNRDYSHAMAYWSAPILFRFVKKVHKVYGAKDSQRMIERTTGIINSKLQKNESKFRTFIIKNMEFRKVPRIFFRCIDPTFGVDEEKSMMKKEMSRLQEELKKNER